MRNKTLVSLGAYTAPRWFYSSWDSVRKSLNEDNPYLDELLEQIGSYSGEVLFLDDGEYALKAAYLNAKIAVKKEINEIKSKAIREWRAMEAESKAAGAWIDGANGNKVIEKYFLPSKFAYRTKMKYEKL